MLTLFRIFFFRINVKSSSYQVHREIQIFLRHPGHLSLREVLEVQSQGNLVVPCLLEYQAHLGHRGDLVLLLPAESPVEYILNMKCTMDEQAIESDGQTEPPTEAPLGPG